MPRWFLAGVLLLVLLLAGYGEVTAQEGIVKWQRYDVNITIQQNSGVAVEEVHEVALVSGATTLKRIIPTDKLETITNIQVLEINPSVGQRNYQPADTGAEYTFKVTRENDQQIIQLHFPPNNVPSTNFIIRYFAVGALRFYDEGDRFEWQPFGNVTLAPINTSTTIVRLPAGFTDEQVGRDSIGVSTDKSFSEGNRVTFVANNIAANDQLEVSVVFPHGVVQGSPPGWQRTFDALQFWTPVLQGGSVILGLLLVVLGPLAVLGWWYWRIRVSPESAGQTPKYLNSPPGDLSPAVAGALLDGRTSPRHIMATLVDMAYHGVLNVNSSSEEESFFPDAEAEPTFNFYAVSPNRVTRPYEETLYRRIFGHVGGEKRQLDAIRRTLYMSASELMNQIDSEIGQAGYRFEGADAIRRQYAAFGGAGIMMSIVLAMLAVVLLGRMTYLVVCPFLGIIAGAIALMVAGFAAPKRTQAGAQEAIRWQAFKRYLRDISTEEAKKYRQRFAQLLPYAVAFGFEQSFVEKFAAADAPTPKWWGKPRARLPDLDRDQAHAWISSAYMSPQPTALQPEKPKSAIRRITQSAKDAPPGALLEHIKPAFQTFLKAANEAFSKAPPLDEDEETNLAFPQQR